MRLSPPARSIEFPLEVIFFPEFVAMLLERIEPNPLVKFKAVGASRGSMAEIKSRRQSRFKRKLPRHRNKRHMVPKNCFLAVPNLDWALNCVLAPLAA
jgi:hypothetical protein